MQTCETCTSIEVPPTNPAEILSRLPAAIFDLTPGSTGRSALIAGDTLQEDTIFGPEAGDGTPQWALAVLLAEERDRFVLGWRTAEALQLGLGRLREIDGHVDTECPHAAGRDLDRVGGQFGVPRPLGFGDCCYWRLLQLLLFQAGPTVHRLLGIAELYTGVRPMAVETLAKIGLVWPVPQSFEGLAGQTFWGAHQYIGADAYWSDEPPALETALDSFWAPLSPTTTYGGLWQPAPAERESLNLVDALNLAKPAGIVVELVNTPMAGRSGCSGSTLRGASTLRGVWIE